jgi:hypothetical protein
MIKTARVLTCSRITGVSHDYPSVREAVLLDLEGVPVRVIRPEHLIALYLEPSARTRKRMERVAALLEDVEVDRPRLDAILSRFSLTLPGELS